MSNRRSHLVEMSARDCEDLDNALAFMAGLYQTLAEHKPLPGDASRALGDVLAKVLADYPKADVDEALSWVRQEVGRHKAGNRGDRLDGWHREDWRKWRLWADRAEMAATHEDETARFPERYAEAAD